LQILKELKQLTTNPKVTTFVMDFEASLWKAVESVFPDQTRRGCVFHWTQAVYRKIQALGRFNF